MKKIILLIIILVLASIFFYPKIHSLFSSDTVVPMVVEQVQQKAVPELGINLPISKDVLDFKYIVKNNAIFFSRTSYEAISSSCLVEQAPFGYLEKVLKSDLTNDSSAEWMRTVEGLKQAEKNGTAKEFDKFYIIQINSQDPTCAVAVGAKGADFSLKDITLIK